MELHNRQEGNKVLDGVVISAKNIVKPKSRKVFTIMDEDYAKVLWCMMNQKDCVRVADYTMIEMIYNFPITLEMAFADAKLIRQINYVPIYQIGFISKILN